MNQCKEVQLYCLKKGKKIHSQYGKISASLILMEHGFFVVFFWICEIFCNIFKRSFSSFGLVTLG